MTARMIMRRVAGTLAAICVTLVLAFAPHQSGRATLSAWVMEPDQTFKDVHDLLRSEDFAALNDSLNAYAKSAMQARGSARPLLDLLVETTSSDPEIESALERWVEAFPASCHALTAVGLQRGYMMVLRYGSVADRDTPPNEVLAPFNRAIDTNPDCVIAYAAAVRSIDSLSLAQEFIEAGLKNNPKSVLLRAQRWWIQARDGSLQLADLDPDLVTQKFGGAETPASSALRREIDMIAAVQLAQNQRPAEAALRFAAALDGWEVPAYRMIRAEFFERLEWFDDARRDYQRVLKLNGDHRQANKKSIRGALRLGRQTAALMHAEQALLHDPRNPDVLIQRARILAQIGEAVDATETIEAALDLGGERPDITQEARAIMLRYELEEVGPLLANALTTLPEDPTTVVDNALAECMPAGCALALVLQAMSEECHRFGHCDVTVANAVKDAMRQQEEDVTAAHGRLTVILDRLQSAHDR